VPDYKTALNNAKCIAFSIPVFDSWYLPALPRKTGAITLPIPGEIARGGHAMCIVGYTDDPSEEYPGGGFFIVRNSWDTTWGSACPFGPGYGTIPYLYIAKYGMEAWIMG
jgi:C1A family cysteine protease